MQNPFGVLGFETPLFPQSIKRESQVDSSLSLSNQSAKVLHNFHLRKSLNAMSSHYGNYLTLVSPNQQNAPYAVPKFETEKRPRSRSFTQTQLSSSNSSNHTSTTSASASASSSYMSTKAVPLSPVPPRNKRSSAPSTSLLPLPQLPLPHPVSPTQRRRSFTSPNIITPRSTFEEGRQSVIGLPSEYPATAIHNRDGSVVSSFASSEASSLLMEELEDFELLFGDELYGTKVYDDTFSNPNPLKCDIPKPPILGSPLLGSDVRARAVSDTTMDSASTASPPRSGPYVKSLKRDSSTSCVSTNSLSSTSSRSRRRRNLGLSQTDFSKITSDFSSLSMQ
ncbi:unnamed protein product [Cylindrotheca closterium]|uniref:Uncharacterized protein n=1 Tax=Cylindrotheca closterium TaxID=2856 RepID=A0AAD2JJ49_9STRA|nr:unnamed protein product [Cylindrotheca closterium]